MIDKKALETTEFYNHRFNNFATRIIIPGLIFILVGFAFLFFAKKEVTINSVGELTPIKQSISVQSTVSSRIVENRLKEGKSVRKGDTLLIYHDVNDPAQVKVLNEQLQRLTRQKTALATLRNSITDNHDYFTGTDEFGYQQILKDYLSQRQIFQLENQRVNTEQKTTNTKEEQIAQLTQKSLDTTKRNIEAYQELLRAIQDNKTYTGSLFVYLYKNYKIDSKDQSGDALTKVKATYINQIQQQLDTFNNNLDTLKLQEANNQQANTSQAVIKETQNKLTSLQSLQLKDVAAQQNQLLQTINDAQTKITVLNDQAGDYTVKAPATGTLHLDSTLTGKKYLPSGSTLAEIYPVITTQKAANLTLSVSPSEISSIKLGQKVRLRIAQNVPAPLILTGTITGIDVAPTVTKNGNVFRVIAKVPLTSTKLNSLYYGLGGQVSIITGKKTYWNTLMDRIFYAS